MDWLGEGLSELAIERLDGHGLTVFTREERLDALEKLGLPAYAHFSRATMLKIAAEIDADYVIFGEYSADGSHLQLECACIARKPSQAFECHRRVGRARGVAANGYSDSVAGTLRNSRFSGRTRLVQHGLSARGGRFWRAQRAFVSMHFSITCVD